MDLRDSSPHAKFTGDLGSATEVTAAHHSWYYTMLEFAKKLKGKEKAAYLKQAAVVSAEQKRRRRNLERRILRAEGAK
jgi:hypothetical protein